MAAVEISLIWGVAVFGTTTGGKLDIGKSTSVLEASMISLCNLLNAFSRPSPYMSGIWILKIPGNEYAASSSRLVTRVRAREIRS